MTNFETFFLQGPNPFFFIGSKPENDLYYRGKTLLSLSRHQVRFTITHTFEI